MEQGSNTSASKLSSRILDEARAEANKIAADAKAAADAENAMLLKRAEEIKADYAKKREQSVSSVLDGANTRAAIDGRKAALAKKRAVIEKAFDETYAKMLSLSDADRKTILKGVLLRETEGGECIVPAKKDRELLKALAAELADRKLTLSDEDADCASGCILHGKGYEKDCSFRSVLLEVREDAETEVSKLLFN